MLNFRKFTEKKNAYDPDDHYALLINIRQFVSNMCQIQMKNKLSSFENLSLDLKNEVDRILDDFNFRSKNLFKQDAILIEIVDQATSVNLSLSLLNRKYLAVTISGKGVDDFIDKIDFSYIRLSPDYLIIANIEDSLRVIKYVLEEAIEQFNE